ncbi:hypothetical protein ACEPAG_8138 [Sanghuangporus baumii]
MFVHRDNRQGPASSRGSGNSGRGILENLDWNHRQELGRGSFGVVYKMQRKDGHGFRAVKCIRRTTRNQDTDQEWRALENLGVHRNIVKCYSHQDIALEGKPHLAIELEYVDGQNLTHHMSSYHRAGRSMPSATVAQFTYQILKGIQFIHSKRYIHRDIKPDNIMLTSTLEVKITDFGLASYVDSSEWKNGFAGTLLYLGPEVFAYHMQGYTTDVWAVGATAFNMLFKGHSPFTVINENEIQQKALRNLGARARDSALYVQEQRRLIFEHYSRIDWPRQIDPWSGNHKDSFAFIKKLLTADYGSRPTADRALNDPWIRLIRPTPNVPQNMGPFIPRGRLTSNKTDIGVHGQAATTRADSGVHGLAPSDPNQEIKCKISKFVKSKV